MALLDERAILKELATMQQWMYESGELSRRFRFRDFTQAFDFVTKAAALQQEQGLYCTVTQQGPIVLIDLRQDNAGVTDRDIALARSLTAAATNAM